MQINNIVFLFTAPVMLNQNESSMNCWSVGLIVSLVINFVLISGACLLFRQYYKVNQVKQNRFHYIFNFLVYIFIFIRCFSYAKKTRIWFIYFLKCNYLFFLSYSFTSFLLHRVKLNFLGEFIQRRCLYLEISCHAQRGLCTAQILMLK